MKIAGYEITLHNHGTFRLDGGAMFGAVPKNLWSRTLPADEENCIPLATRCMLLKKDELSILVDCGNGDKWSDKLRQIFAIKNTPTERLGYNFDDISHLLLTHLHFDHCGGMSYLDDNKELQPRYKNATTIVQEDNLKNAKSPNNREKASYLKENYGVLDSCETTLVKGSVEVFPNVWVHQVNGHTVGQQYIEVRGTDRILLYPTDLIPTSHHLPVPYNMGYDICTQTILDEKAQFLKYALENDAIVVFEHDPEIAAATICLNDRGHYAVKELIDIKEYS